MSESDFYSEENATFGDRLAAARRHAGMTQGQMARRLGVKLGSLRKWEEDMSEPRANRLSMMAGILNVSLSWLLTGEGEGLPDPDEEASTDLAGMLVELRDLRHGLRATVDRMARLEKRIRKSME